ncbi:MAG: Signal transduction histidine kinase NtrY [Thermodesulfobacterium sp.]|uniref:histidine kinase n=1 Tax=Candidatus Thermodesulfobacterium syntrophicum TaxID=3060442 RepID=A0AAE3TET3_9BACT|nr:Signal transduction histidine kinase NtrY [Candidatus Thermodesulfobacterium syntrophicum]
MSFWKGIKTFFKKYKILIFVLFFIGITLWLEFNIFDFSFLSLSQKNVFLFLLFQLNLIFILVLLYFIFRYLFKIFWEIQPRRISKSIKIKLFATYFISIIFPSLILILGSFFFFKKTLDYWLKEFFEEKVISQFMKAEDYYKETERYLLVKGQEIIKNYISKAEELKSKDLREKYRYFSSLDSIEIYNYFGERYKRTYSSEIPGKLGIPPSILEKLKTDKTPVTQTSIIGSKALVRVFIPCKDKYGNKWILATGKVLNLQKFAESESFPEKKYFKIFKKFLLMAGASILLLIIFVGIWVGSKIGRNLTEPLRNLVLATQKISQKDYHIEEIPLTTFSEDEIGILMKSFKEMVEKLKEYEEEMKRYNEYLISILNHLPVGILILNQDFQIRYLNESLKKFLQTYGFNSIEELLGHLDFFNLIHTVDLDTPFYRVFEFSKEAKEVFLGVTVLKLNLFREENLMAIIENLEEKENLKRLSIWKEVAVRIAHEIKNPLTPIKLSVERLRRKLEKSLEGETKEVLLKTTEVIEKYVEELKKLATDFYYFSKKPVLNFERGNLLENLIEVVNLYEIAYPDVKFSIQADDDGECIFDKFHFKRLWINLIDNSIKAMQEKGKIEIFLKRADGHIVVKVVDSGKGIQEDIAKSIADGDLIKLKEFGTGLVMAYSIVKLHKGTFQIGKNFPSGTSITIEIPCNLEIKED